MIDHRLHVLRVVAELGTVTEAARRLGYTPSAVSHQLKSLSKDLGIAVVEPQGRGLRLTAAGSLLLERTQELFTRWEEIRGEIAEAGTGAAPNSRILRLCGFSTAAATLLPPTVDAVRRRHPDSTVTIIEAGPEECFELLLADQADVAVVVATDPLPPRSDARFEQDTLLSDRLDLLVPDGHPLACRASVSLSNAAEESWIVDRPGTPYHRLVRAACAAAGFAPEVAHLSHEWETGAALVSAGLGVSLIPRLARLPHGYAVHRVPLRGDPVPSRTILTGIRSGSSRQPLIAAALAGLQDIAATLGQNGGDSRSSLPRVPTEE
ncbi:DNA-binding transcriptional LysR family regulator [Brevibacterium sanguinis]|uniref:DNA-binding transcriptional LysR family regulator n=2 Tax=Brevibacterium TaxID=1696 RepID=A0A366IPK5_9MICO|nr:MULTISPECIES: LysR family transcriptional regulator [Brevibacterium]RBP67185.1 DNA-binding transcriptional LysR family regulator [Brevibacterium sanguinis]RBP73710.1 DNA-binding transcriptional LysR family regulator [Brevibacterium celere]